jgi:anti-anti-sigma factor
MEKPTEIKIENQDGLSLLRVIGDLTSYSEPYLNDAYHQIDQDPGIKSLIFVFENDAYINSGGIAALIQILVEIRKSNRQVGIAGTSDHFIKIFKMVGISKLARIFGSLDEALATMV